VQAVLTEGWCWDANPQCLTSEPTSCTSHAWRCPQKRGPLKMEPASEDFDAEAPGARVAALHWAHSQAGVLKQC
jgi:hypothetical protein